MMQEHKNTPLADHILVSLKNEPHLAWIQKFLNDLPDADLYMVGGAVRDIILERSNKDFDIVACGLLPERLVSELKKIGIVDLVGVNFGVYKFHPSGVSDPQYFIDIALPRTEIPKNTGGYRDVKVTSDPYASIETDLARRDFTFNALAFDLRTLELIDPYGGLADLDARIVRAVRDPRMRFQEDYTRVLRALRFAVQLDAKIEDETWQAITNFTSNLLDTRDGKRLVPPETIGIEFLKAFTVDTILTLKLWQESGALHVVMPELSALQTCEQPPKLHSEGTVWQHTLLALESLESEDFRARFGKPTLRAKLATLFHDIGKPPTRKEPETSKDTAHFYDHAKAGKQIVFEIEKRIKFDSAPVDSPLHINKEDIMWLVDRHMIGIDDATGNKPRTTTIEKIFFIDPRGADLLAIMYADEAGTRLPDESNCIPRFEKFEQYIKEVESSRASTSTARKPLVCAADLMARGIKPGPKLGALLNEAREIELHGEHNKETIISKILT